MQNTAKPKHGGSRKGAGRPKKEATVTLSYRVPEKQAPKIDLKIKQIIAEIKAS